MATTLYLCDEEFTTQAAPDPMTYSSGSGSANLRGTASIWFPMPLSTTRDNGVRNVATNTVAGATAGVEVGSPFEWYSLPLAADVTISGSITWNLWASESNMSANVAINGRLEVVDGATGTITLIDQTARTTEVAVTTRAVNNFSETPAAGVACKAGDRLRVRIFGDDAGTMGSGYTFSFSWSGTTGGADGDSYLTLTENLTFVTSEPAGTQVFLTDVASDVSTASEDLVAWTSRGSGQVDIVTNTVSGWTNGVQLTRSGGGTVVDWFTPLLTAFTLSGTARVNLWGLESNGAAQAMFACEIARVDGDGTNPVVWGRNGWVQTSSTELGTFSTFALRSIVSGDDLAVANGQRIRIRVYLDDSTLSGPLVTGYTTTLMYGWTAGGSEGDTFVTFSQTLTEYVPDTRVTKTNRYHQLLAH